MVSAALKTPKRELTLRDVFERNFDYVYASARRCGINEADAEDVVQDVFLVVHRRFADFDQSRPVRPWLFGITYRVARDFRKLARHRREFGDEENNDTRDTGDAVCASLPPKAKNPEEHAVGADDKSLVLRALDSVKEERRGLFVMHAIDETPMPQVAETLGIPLNTAYSRYRLAKQEFEKALKALWRKEVGDVD